MPAFGQICSSGNFHHRTGLQAIGCTSACGENMQVHARCQLQGATNEIAGRRGRKDQALLISLEFFARRQHMLNGQAAALHNRAHGLFHNVGQAASFVARCGVGTAVCVASFQIAVVPIEFSHNALRHFKAAGSVCQLFNGIAYFGVFTEHDGGASANQQIGRKTYNRVGSDARECIAATTLHAHHQLAGRHCFAASGIQARQVWLGAFHNVLQHGHEAHMLVILQTNGVGSVSGRSFVDQWKTAWRQQALRW